MTNTRDNNFDLLRCICCVAVIFIHVSATYKTAITDNELFGVLLTNNIQSTVIYNTLSRFAVPCFVMLAGAFALKNDKNANYRYYYRKTFSNIGIPVLVFTGLYFLFQIVKCFARIVLRNETYSILWNPIRSLITGAPYYHMWYLYVMIILYCMVPILIRWKNDISKRTFNKIVAVILFVSVLSGWTSTSDCNWGIISFAYLGYFLSGYVIAEKCKQHKNNVHGICMILLGIVTELGVSFVQYQHSLQGLSEADERYSIIGPLNPVIGIAAIFIFVGFALLKVKKDFRCVSTKTFLIYLIHVGLWDTVKMLVKNINPDFSYIIIPVSVVVIFAISYGITIVYEKIWNFLEKKFRISERLCNVIIPF